MNKFHASILTLVVTVSLGILPGSAFSATSAELNCHQNGEGGSKGTVTVSYSFDKPVDPKQPARDCNSKYSTCGNTCWGCVYWPDMDGIAKCYDGNGTCKYYCN